MATQQILFLEAIAGIRKGLKRKPFDSDSDETIDVNKNRGQKTKKRARFTKKGQLAPPTGPQVYREEVEYAGAKRTILNRNPPLVDDDGYEVDSEEEEARVQRALNNAAEENPYAGLRLENILAPLTSVTDLATHQTLSVPYKSKLLTELADQCGELARKENRALWRIKHLMAGLCGDYPWGPCGLMLGPNDNDVFAADNILRLAQQRATANDTAGSSPRTLNDDTRPDGQADDTEARLVDNDQAVKTNGKITNGGDADMVDHDHRAEPRTNEPTTSAKVNGKRPTESTAGGMAGKPQENSNAADGATSTAAQASGKRKERGGKEHTTSEEDTTMQDADPAPSGPNGGKEGETQSGRKAAQPPPMSAPDAVGGTGDTASGGDDDDVVVLEHPLFRIPQSARPDRDMGLPEADAEHLRHMLALYVQKQEEICRGATKLHSGLLKTDRMRKSVLKWSKAEAHCGSNRDLSDGEDWYDMEEWGLAEDLKKGQDEEEEETGTTTKKTRNRK